MPALKYIVATMTLYQIFLCHILSFVTRYPTNAEAKTERNVPSSVLATEISVASPNP